MHNSVVGLASAQRMESPSPGALFLCDSIFSLEDVARMRAASHTTDRKYVYVPMRPLEMNFVAV